MPVNLDKPHLWNADIQRSVDLYNDWFLQFAPQTFRETRVRTTEMVESALVRTADLSTISPEVLIDEPRILAMLRMTTAPPLARDRLIGLASVSDNLVDSMEDADRPRIPPRMPQPILLAQLRRIGDVIERLADRDIFPWLQEGRSPSEAERYRASTIVADRLCGSQSDPIIRNAQETWQLGKIQKWLEGCGYTAAAPGMRFGAMSSGSFAFRLNAEGQLESGAVRNIPIDVVVKPLTAAPADLPLMIEAKSAGDFTNVNKRRKEEADKVANLRRRYGPDVHFILFLRGYFNAGYLGYEAAANIDWVWEHRIDDLAKLGL